MSLLPLSAVTLPLTVAQHCYRVAALSTQIAAMSYVPPLEAIMSTGCASGHREALQLAQISKTLKSIRTYTTCYC